MDIHGLSWGLVLMGSCGRFAQGFEKKDREITTSGMFRDILLTLVLTVVICIETWAPTNWTFQWQVLCLHPELRWVTAQRCVYLLGSVCFCASVCTYVSLHECLYAIIYAYGCENVYIHTRSMQIYVWEWLSCMSVSVYVRTSERVICLTTFVSVRTWVHALKCVHVY